MNTSDTALGSHRHVKTSDGLIFNYYPRGRIGKTIHETTGTMLYPWEPQTTKIMIALSKANLGDVIIGGAYLGEQALVAAAHTLRNVHAFEPGLVKQLLDLNVASNVLTNVKTHQKTSLCTAISSGSS